MFSHMLVPVDFSERNDAALQIALQLAQLSRAHVHLLHVIKLISGDSYEAFQDFYEKLEEDAMQKMAVMRRPFADIVSVSEHIVVGHRVREIVTFAQENAVDLIVMSSHKVDLENPDAGWGTISHKVGILAQCPILLVK
jgi:universal stress protein A